MFILSLTNLISGIFIGLSLVLTQMESVSICLFIAGIAQGVTDVSSNTLLANLWKDKCANFLQALHLSKGIGSLVILIISRPFLLPSTGDDYHINSNDHNHGLEIDNDLPTVDHPLIDQIYSANGALVKYAFHIFALLSIATSLPYMFIYCNERRRNMMDPLVEIDLYGDENDNLTEQGNLKIYGAVVLVVITGHCIHSLCSLIGSLTASFIIRSDLDMDREKIIQLIIVFWSLYSFSRLIYMIAAVLIVEIKLLICWMMITLVGIIFTVQWANYSSKCCWIGISLLAIGISPVWAATYGKLNKYFPISNQTQSIIITICNLGESIHPAIAAALMYHQHSNIFLHYLASLSLIFIVSLLLFTIYCQMFIGKSPLFISKKMSLSRL